MASSKATQPIILQDTIATISTPFTSQPPSISSITTRSSSLKESFKKSTKRITPRWETKEENEILKDERSILGFWDSEKVGNVSNKVLLLVIKAWITNHKVPTILIDRGNTCDIMHVSLIEELRLKIKKLFFIEAPTYMHSTNK